MIPTHFLYQLADYEGIKVEWKEFSEVEGIYISTPSMISPVIALSRSLQGNERKLRCVFSHELGHHFETVGHHMIAASGTSSIYRTKNELLATKWAVNLMIDTYTFLKKVKEGMNGQDLADYFWVLPEFVVLKGEMLKESEEYAEAVAELKASYNANF